MFGPFSRCAAMLVASAAVVGFSLLGEPTATATTEIAAVKGVPPATVVSGTPRERGAAYGKQFREEIRKFLQQEIYTAFIQKPSPKDELLRYAAACAVVIKEECPEIHAELAGVAEGAG